MVEASKYGKARDVSRVYTSYQKAEVMIGRRGVEADGPEKIE
jgi:hypothetical protein